MFIRMTQTEQDQLMGKVVREYGERDRALRALVVEAKRMGARLSSLAESLQETPFGVMEINGELSGGDMSGATVTEQYRDSLDYDRVMQLEQDVRVAARELRKLRDQKRSLGV
jgi:hypothetical protein